MASPAAFSRAMRLQRYISHLAAALSLPNRWKFEIAAMLSQLGCVTMAPETIDAVYAGRLLSAKEQALYDTHPAIAGELLKNIPRMESIAWMIAHQNRAASVEGDISDREMEEMRLGAELLRVALAFDALVREGISRSEAAHNVARQNQGLDARIPVALMEVEPEDQEKEVRPCRIEEISPGMIIDEDVRTESGLLIIAKNQEVTPSLVLKLKNYYEMGVIGGEIRVSMPQVAAHAQN
jgi:HD domain-containing protein